jgi:hypothetical protein
LKSLADVACGTEEEEHGGRRSEVRGQRSEMGLGFGAWNRAFCLFR